MILYYLVTGGGKLQIKRRKKPDSVEKTEKKK